MGAVEISLRQANRYLLTRQNLLSPCANALQAVRDACGLQAQIPSTPALSLRARVASFTLADYDRMLSQERTLVRTWAMRGTVHTLPADTMARFTYIYVDEASPLAEPAAKALTLLQKGPGTRNGLAQRAVAELGVPPETAREWFGPWGGVLRTLARRNLSVHMPTDSADVPVILTEQWLGRIPEIGTLDDLQAALLCDYLQGYGPATAQDFASFTGLSQAWARPAFERLREELVEVRLEGSNLPHYMLKTDLPALSAITGEEPAPVRVLPRFDSILLAYKDRQRIIDDRFRTRVYRPAAVVEAVVLVDGRVAGTWRMKKTTRELQVVYEPFRRPRGGVAPRAVAAEFQRLARWLGLERLNLTVATEAGM